jgi:hypothetical protein
VVARKIQREAGEPESLAVKIISKENVRGRRGLRVRAPLGSGCGAALP